MSEVRLTDEALFSDRSRSRQYDGGYDTAPGLSGVRNEMDISTARTAGTNEEELITMIANTIAHEVGHPLFREKGLYPFDVLSNTAEVGSIMEGAVDPQKSAADPRGFSESDAQLLCELLNEK
jgi:hypothetical protein